MNDSKNPAAVAIELSRRPCSKASGIRVSASEAKTRAACESEWEGQPLLGELGEYPATQDDREDEQVA